MNELLILKGMLEYDHFSKYSNILLGLRNLENEWFLILQSLKSYYKEYPDHKKLTADELHSWFFYQNPNLYSQESYTKVIDRLRDIEIDNPELLSAVLNSVVEKHIMAQISGVSLEVLNNQKPTGMEDIHKLMLEYKQLVAAAKDAENDVCDTPVAELFSPEPDGLRWRLQFLNEKLGPLRKRTLGHIYARPDGGKTSLAISEVTFLAQQMNGRPILYLNNEEDIRRIKRWAICSMLNVTEEWVINNLDEAEMLWQDQGGDNIKFIGSVDSMDQVEKYIENFNPRVVIIDQGPNVILPQVSKKMSEVGILKELYFNYRNLAKKFDTSIITLGQASEKAENRQILYLSHISDSKTHIPGHLDFALGIGFVDDPKFWNYRWLNIAKNKFGGRGQQKQVIFDSTKSRFSDAIANDSNRR